MRVYIVDDDPQIRKALSRWFNLNGFQSESYSSAESCLEQLCTSYIPACVVLDLRMGKMSGLALQQHLIKLAPHWPIIFLSGHGQISTAIEAVKQGAMEFLEKPVDNQLLLKVVSSALERSESLVNLIQDKDKLTSREREIVDFLAFGFSSKEIASELDLSVKTVEYHRYNIKSKINLSAFKRNLISIR